MSKTELLLQSAIDIPLMKEAEEEADSFMVIGCKQQNPNQLIRAIPHANMFEPNRTLIAW